MRARKLLALGIAVLASGVVAVGCGGDDSSSSDNDNASSSSSGGDKTIKLAYLSDCEGAFGAFYEPDIAGANTAFIKYAGGKAAGSKPSDGLDGATVAGAKIELVGIGCANDTADKAIEETRRLMEQEDADVLIGPLSGDEGIAVANYAKEHPDKTFINGTSGAQDTTLKVQAPNFFRFHSDGAQWSAGLGDYAYNELGWKKAAIIGDDYSFPYTSLAGFVAEFCAVGGQITKRIWPPLGEKDYSSFISQIPDDVDGIYYGIGGAGLVSFMKQYQEQKGKIDPKKTMGNVFFDDPLVLEERLQRGHRRVHGRPDGGGLQRPEGQGLRPSSSTTPTARRSPALAPSVFVYDYYNAGLGADQGPRGGQRRHQRSEQAPGGSEVGDVGRAVGRDQARRQPQRRRGQLRQGDRPGQHRRQDPRRARRSVASRASSRPSVARSPRTRRRRTATNPKCEKGNQPAWVGNSETGRLLVEVAQWLHLRHLPSAPSRSSACGGSAGASAASTPSTGWTSRSRPANAGPSSAPTAPARRRCST